MKLTASLEQNQDLSQNQNLQQAEFANLANQVQQHIGNQLDALPDTDRIALKSAIVQAVADLGGGSSTINFIEYNKDSGVVSYRVNDFLEGSFDAQRTLDLRDMQRERTDDGILPIFKETINLSNLRDQIEQKTGDLLRPFSTDYHSILKDALTTGCFGKTRSIDSTIDNIVIRPDNGFLEAKIDQNYYVSIDPSEVINEYLAKNRTIPSPNPLDKQISEPSITQPTIDAMNQILEQSKPQVSTLESVQEALNAINQTLAELNTMQTITVEGPEKLAEHAYVQIPDQQSLEQPLSVTVESGDTMERIARRVVTERYGENATQQDVLRVTAQMIEANGFTNQAQLNRLQIGQELIIPNEHASFEAGLQIYGRNAEYHEARIQAEQARQAELAQIQAQQAQQVELERMVGPEALAQAKQDGIALMQAEQAKLAEQKLSTGQYSIPVEIPISNEQKAEEHGSVYRFFAGAGNTIVNAVAQPFVQVADMTTAAASVIYNEGIRGKDDPYWFPEQYSNIAKDYQNGKSHGRILIESVPFAPIGTSSYDATTAFIEGRNDDAVQHLGEVGANMALGFLPGPKVPGVK